MMISVTATALPPLPEGNFMRAHYRYMYECVIFPGYIPNKSSPSYYFYAIETPDEYLVKMRSVIEEKDNELKKIKREMLKDFLITKRERYEGVIEWYFEELSEGRVAPPPNGVEIEDVTRWKRNLEIIDEILNSEYVL